MVDNLHVFSMAELEEFTMKQLRRLANYYQVAYNKNTTKKELINNLYPVLGVIDPSEYTEDPPMSLRVKRIRDWAKEHPDG